MRNRGQIAVSSILTIAGSAVGCVIWVYNLVLPIKDDLSDAKIATAQNVTDIKNLDSRLIRIENKIDASLERQGIDPRKYNATSTDFYR